MKFTEPSSYWFIAFTMALFGWVEALVLEMLRLESQPLGIAGGALLLATLAAVFALPGLAPKIPAVRSHYRWIVIGSVPWMLTALTVSLMLSSTAAWACVMTSALAPLIYLWLAHLTTPIADRRRSFFYAWSGMTIVAAGLMILVHLVPNGRLVFEWSLLPLALFGFVLPAPSTFKRSLIPVRPNRVGGAAIGLFFVLGLGASEAARLASLSPRLPWAATVFLGVTSLLVLVALPFAFKRSRHVLAYVSAVFLAVALLGFVEPGTGDVVVGLEFLMLIAANLLSLWWSVSLISTLRRAPQELALAIAVTTAAFAAGWWLPVMTGQHSSWLIAVLVVVIATPFLMGGTRSEAPASSGYRGNPEELFNRAKLTPQERRIVQLLLQGKSNQAIIQELYVSINTLKTHLKNIYRKTETSNRRELIDLVGQQHSQSSGQ